MREIIFLVFAGLRGAIAFALARNAASEHRRTIVAATTATIVFTTFVLGGLTRHMLRWLGMIDTTAALGHGGAADGGAADGGDGDGGGGGGDDDDDDGGGGGGARVAAGGDGDGGGMPLDVPSDGPSVAPPSALSAARARRDDGGEIGRRWERLDKAVLQPLFGGPEHPGPGAAAAGKSAATARSKVRARRPSGSIELEPLGPSDAS